MKIIIEHSNTKREINGSFKICGSREDLKRISRAIENCLEDGNVCYGWVSVYDEFNGTPNTKPIQWD